MSKNTTIMVTGGAGFLGSSVVRRLKSEGYEKIHVVRKSQCDLTEQAAVRALVSSVKPNAVIHLAAVVGGIGANRENPGKFFYENAMMGLVLIEEARLQGVEKFVSIGTICAYPKLTPVPFKEDDLWLGYPEETNAPYGLAKKMQMVQCQSYRDQYSFNAIHLLPVNLYGPGDNFNPQSSHVIPAMIQKFVDAKLAGASKVTLWGDGTPTREFLYVDDAARGIVLAMEKYNGREPVNLGSGEEISIRDLASIMAEATGYKGEIIWDIEKPNGQPRRKLDTTRARQEFGFQAETSFAAGIKQTVEWYLSQNKVAAWTKQ